jgi:tetratricopeptide (TPR) repeat protein
MSKTSMDAHFESAERFENEGRLDEAIEELRRALRLDPGCSEAILRLGRLFYLSKRFPESISSFIHAEARGAKLNADDFFTLGEAYAAKSFHRKAIESYDRSLALADRADIHVARGNSFQTLQDFSRAAQAYEDALRLEPNHGGAIFSLACVYAKGADFRRALQEYEKWIHIQPEFGATLHAEAVAQLNNGSPSGALEKVEMILKENAKDAEAWFLLGSANADLRQVEFAVQALEECLKLSTHHALALSLLTHLRQA